jgi:hypothetical protein
VELLGVPSQPETRAEYDRLGQDEFLDAYGFKQAREYLIVHDGRTYDSEAIAAVASATHHLTDGGATVTAVTITAVVSGVALAGKLWKKDTNGDRPEG